jgi:hypothetical protein
LNAKQIWKAEKYRKMQITIQSIRLRQKATARQGGASPSIFSTIFNGFIGLQATFGRGGMAEFWLLRGGRVVFNQ